MIWRSISYSRGFRSGSNLAKKECDNHIKMLKAENRELRKKIQRDRYDHEREKVKLSESWDKVKDAERLLLIAIGKIKSIESYTKTIYHKKLQEDAAFLASFQGQISDIESAFHDFQKRITRS